MVDFEKLFDSFSSVRVAVIGDVMLDTYVWGKVERISPEAPVPVVTVEKKEYRIGGAGNVALNLRALGAEVAVLSVTGSDTEGDILQELFQKHNIGTRYLQRVNNRITTNKTRVISRNQQMMRLDAEITDDLNQEQENLLLNGVKELMEKERPQVLIFEDYNKGVLTASVINEVMAVCRQHGVVTTVDPKRKNFFSFSGVDIFKPNLKEVREALNLLADDVSISAMQSIHKELKSRLEHLYSFITLSDRGIFYHGDITGSIIPSHVRSIADVSGAGDTVIATASLVYAVTKDIRLAAEIANIAGGLVCEEVGTAAIDKETLLQECNSILAAQ